MNIQVAIQCIRRQGSSHSLLLSITEELFDLAAARQLHRMASYLPGRDNVWDGNGETKPFYCFLHLLQRFSEQGDQNYGISKGRFCWLISYGSRNLGAQKLRKWCSSPLPLSHLALLR
ncbi:hypothetical protein Pmani_013247 [Petrolisthes manimaculis]|uniref:Uncharacterized protein n=1 Tax=Petrolisthes manimaculis TaxID=1843537 RepID=A0AAE1PVN6_9EUCA|nr:hypothetical protein Pmani_013247 [Petrolisthes manimaculis]